MGRSLDNTQRDTSIYKKKKSGGHKSDLRRWHKLSKEESVQPRQRDKLLTWPKGCEGENSAEVGVGRKEVNPEGSHGWRRLCCLIGCLVGRPWRIQAGANAFWFPLEMDDSSCRREMESEESKSKREGGQWAPFPLSGWKMTATLTGTESWGRREVDKTRGVCWKSGW